MGLKTLINFKLQREKDATPYLFSRIVLLTRSYAFWQSALLFARLAETTSTLLISYLHHYLSIIFMIKFKFKISCIRHIIYLFSIYICLQLTLRILEGLCSVVKVKNDRESGKLYFEERVVQ